MSKRVLKVKNARIHNGSLWCDLAEDDDQRGWEAGKSIKTSRVLPTDVGPNMYETKNTIYHVID